MEINMKYVLQTLEEIMKIDSPSGYTAAVMEKIEQKAQELGYGFETTHKGNGVIPVRTRSTWWAFARMWIRWGSWCAALKRMARWLLRRLAALI